MNKMNISYEEAITQLELILKELEDDGCTLEESLKKFKKGMELYDYCNNLLTKAEGEIKILLEDDKGNLIDMEFPLEG